MGKKQNKQDGQTITVYQLRKILFQINNQDMTIAELRRELFDLPDDAVIEVDGDERALAFL